MALKLAPFPVGHHALDALYHQGLRELPHASLVYPLWPVLLGAGGALIGLERAAVLLPPLFYVLSLVLLYALANRLAGRW